MSVRLTDKIEPLNDAFVGMVDADQIVETPAGFKDEDAMGSDSATAFCSQQSIKKYVDDNAGGTVDTSGTPVANDFARFTDADTIAGLDYAETRTALGLVIGTNVLAEQTIGIADDNLVEIDSASVATGEYAKFTANGLESKSIVEAKADLGVIVEKSITVESPTSSEDITWFFTNRAITVTEMRAVLSVGTSTPSVTWTIRHHASDRSNAGAEVVTGGTTTTSITTGSDVTSFDDATIPADSYVWVETSAQSGTVPELHITLIASID